MEFLHLFRLLEVVIICVLFALFHLREGENAVRSEKYFKRNSSNLRIRTLKKLRLLGQNVDSYLWYGGGLKKDFKNASEIAKATL